MKTLKGNLNKNNYVFHEIKQIKGKQNLPLDEFEIIEDLAEVHEIKEISNNNKYNQINNNLNLLNQQRFEERKNIQLEENGRDIQYNGNNYQQDELPLNYENDKILCNECHHEIDDTHQKEMNLPEDQNMKNEEEEQPIKYGYVDTAFFSSNEKNEIDNKESNEDIYSPNENKEEEKINNLIESVFQQLSNDDIFNNENIKLSFGELNEDGKNEFIEGIRIKIDNQEQENRFNKLLEIIK